MHEIDDNAEAMKVCARCGGHAFYWRTAIVAGDPMAARSSGRRLTHQQPAWTCMNCGYIEPHERRIRAEAADAERRLV